MLDETVVHGPLLHYKNTSRLSRGDDVDVVERYTYRDFMRMPRGPVPDVRGCLGAVWSMTTVFSRARVSGSRAVRRRVRR